MKTGLVVTSYPNCSGAGISLWQCLKENQTTLDASFHSIIFLGHTTSGFIVALCLVNTVICYVQFNQQEYKVTSIPLVLRMKFVFSLVTVVFWLPAQLSFLQIGFHIPVITVLPLCTLFLFIYLVFTVAYNWAAMGFSFLCVAKSLQLSQTRLYFENKTFGHAVAFIILLLSMIINIRVLLFQRTGLCLHQDEAFCTTHFPFISTLLTAVVGHLLPWIACLFVLGVMVWSRRDFIRQSHVFVDPSFQRLYNLCFSTTIAFTASNVLWVAFSNYAGSAEQGGVRESNLLSNAFFVTAIALRHIGFSCDWVIFLLISPLFRFQAKQFIHSTWSAFKEALNIR